MTGSFTNAYADEIGYNSRAVASIVQYVCCSVTATFLQMFAVLAWHEGECTPSSQDLLT